MAMQTQQRTGDALPPPFAGFAPGDAPSYEVLNTCVQCGLCLPACPTYRETYREQSSPRGRLHLMKAVHDGRLDVLDPGFVGQMHECLDCRACEAVCPSGVRYGEVLEATRAQIVRATVERGAQSQRERALRVLVFSVLFPRMWLFRTASATARLYQRSGGQRLARASGLLRRLGLAELEAQLPAMSDRFFTPRGQLFPARGARRGRVGLLTGCIMHTAYAEIHRATMRVLRQNGWEVSVPAGQGCCGALHTHAGDLERSRALARRIITAFEVVDVDVVISNAAGCGAMLKEYGHLLKDDPVWAARARAFSARTRDLTELLAEHPLRGPLGTLNLTVTYQEPCHLAHAQRISAGPRALLRQLPGLRLVEMAEASLCCGSAGTYSITQPEMSRRLRARKLNHALATGATVIATANPGCMLHLRAGLAHRAPASGVEVQHIVELLDLAYQTSGRETST